jgi:hypothetical protein
VELHTRLITQIQLLHTQICYLLNTGTGVVEKQEERTITDAVPSLAWERSKQSGDLFTFQEASLRRRNTLYWNGGDALACVKHIGDPAPEVFEERPEGCESLIARSNVVSSDFLEVFQESQSSFETEIRQHEPGDRPTSLTRDEG